MEKPAPQLHLLCDPALAISTSGFNHDLTANNSHACPSGLRVSPGHLSGGPTIFQTAHPGPFSLHSCTRATPFDQTHGEPPPGLGFRPLPHCSNHGQSGDKSRNGSHLVLHFPHSTNKGKGLAQSHKVAGSKTEPRSFPSKGGATPCRHLDSSLSHRVQSHLPYTVIGI